MRCSERLALIYFGFVTHGLAFADLWSLGVIAIPFMFEAAFRTPVHFGVIWRKMIHAVIPAATFADGEFPELFTIHVQPRFCIGWDSAMRTPNHSLEPTASVPVRLAIEFICGFHTSVTRWLSFFVRRHRVTPHHDTTELHSERHRESRARRPFRRLEFRRGLARVFSHEPHATEFQSAAVRESRARCNA